MPDLNEEGNIEGVFAYVIDTTEQKRAELERETTGAELQQAKKLEALGVLAGGIAHDFNNLLAPIIGFADLAQDSLPEDSPVAEYTGEILKAAGRTKELVEQILLLARKSERQHVIVDLVPLMNEAMKLLRASIPSTVEIQQRISPDAGCVLGDPSQIHQVVVNLCTNAYQAMSASGGTLGVQVKKSGPPPGRKKSVYVPAAPTHVRISVSDTGPGIDPAIREKLFEPFFTTKEPSKGTGLGLSVVQGLVKRHRGVIQLESNTPRGSIFHVYFPSVEAKQIPKQRLRKTLPRGRERILLVEDEQAITAMVRQMLEGLGYHVTDFWDSVAALKKFQQSPRDFDLVIADIMMPRMTGLELARKVSETRPGVPMMLMTGFSEASTAEGLREAGVRELLMKPFVREDLAVTVRNVLDGRAFSAADGAGPARSLGPAPATDR